MPEIPSKSVITRTEKYQIEKNYFDRWQRRFLYFGAFYDGFFGVMLYVWAVWSTKFFHLVVPQPGKAHEQEWIWRHFTADFFEKFNPERGQSFWSSDSIFIWVHLVGILLIILSLLYILAGRNPGRYLGIVLICIVGKIWSVFFYLYYCFVLGAPYAFLTFCGLDFVFFFLHIWALGPDRKNRVFECLEKARLHP